MTFPTPPDGVIFDCDGVIVDSEPITDAVLLADLTGRGLPITADDLPRLFHGGTIRGVAETVRGMGVDLPADWVDAIYDEIHAALEQGTPLVPGIVDLLDRLDARGIPYIVGSNGSRRKMTITLGQNDLMDRLGDRLVSAHEEGTAKPDPTLYLIAAERIGVAPARCAVIEDTPTGARAAVAAGMRCLGHAARTPADRLAEVGAEPFPDMAAIGRALGV